MSTNRGIGDTGKDIKKNDIYVNCNFVVWQKNVSWLPAVEGVFNKFVPTYRLRKQ